MRPPAAWALIAGQWAKHLGAAVIGFTAGSEEKIARLPRKHGYDHRYHQLSQRKLRRTGARTHEWRGVDVVYDSVGRDTYMGSLGVLKPLGMFACFRLVFQVSFRLSDRRVFWRRKGSLFDAPDVVQCYCQAGLIWKRRLLKLTRCRGKRGGQDRDQPDLCSQGRLQRPWKHWRHTQDDRHEHPVAIGGDDSGGAYVHRCFLLGFSRAGLLDKVAQKYFGEQCQRAQPTGLFWMSAGSRKFLVSSELAMGSTSPLPRVKSMRFWVKTARANPLSSKCCLAPCSQLEGQIVWKGQGVAIHEPAAARKLGIGMVFQHFSLFDSLTAAENIALSLDRSLPLAEVARRAREVGRTYGLPVDPQAHVGDLSVGSVSASKSYAVSSSNPTSSFSMSRHRC